MQRRKKKLFHGVGQGHEQKIELLFILRANSSADLLYSYTMENKQPFLRSSHLGARLGKGEVWGFQLGIPHYCRGLVPQAIIFLKLRIHYQDIIILATKRRTRGKKAPIFLLISTRFNDKNGLGFLKLSDAGGQQGCLSFYLRMRRTLLPGVPHTWRSACVLHQAGLNSRAYYREQSEQETVRPLRGTGALPSPLGALAISMPKTFKLLNISQINDLQLEFMT